MERKESYEELLLRMEEEDVPGEEALKDSLRKSLNQKEREILIRLTDKEVARSKDKRYQARLKKYKYLSEKLLIFDSNKYYFHIQYFKDNRDIQESVISFLLVDKETLLSVRGVSVANIKETPNRTLGTNLAYLYAIEGMESKEAKEITDGRAIKSILNTSCPYTKHIYINPSLSFFEVERIWHQYSKRQKENKRRIESKRMIKEILEAKVLNKKYLQQTTWSFPLFETVMVLVLPGFSL